MSFIRPSTSSGAAAAAAAAAPAPAPRYLNVASVSNSITLPSTLFSPDSFRPINSDGRGKAGPLNDEEQKIVNAAIDWHLNNTKKAFSNIDPNLGEDQAAIKIMMDAKEDLKFWRETNKHFGQKNNYFMNESDIPHL